MNFKHLASWSLGLATLLSFSSPVHALGVDADGWVTCDAGKVPVYWEEYVGMDEKYRRIFAFEFGGEPREVLLHHPLDGTSEILHDMTGGTNIPFRGLEDSKGDAFGAYRFLLMVQRSEHESTDYGGEPVRALLVSSYVFWPVCATSEAVEGWHRDARAAP